VLKAKFILENDMRKGLFFATLLAFVMLAPVGAQAGQPVKQTFTCPGGSFLTGLQGRAGDWLDQFQPVCRPWTPGQTGADSYGDNFGNVNGGSRAVRSVCAPGSAIVGFSYGEVTPNGWPGHVYNVIVRCAILPSVFPGYLDIPLDGPFGSNISGSFCGGGQVAQVAKGLVIGLDGINITSLEMECDTPNNIMGVPPALAAGPPQDPPGSWSGVDLPGNDYYSYQEQYPAMCKWACDSAGKCQAWTWAWPRTNGAVPTCYLKSAIPPQVACSYCISGTKPVPKLGLGSKLFNQVIGLPPAPAGGAAAVDMPGNDYHSYPSPNPANCQLTCQGDAKCQAWTWAQQGTNGVAAPTCYLKNPAPLPKTNSCCISGTKPVLKLKLGSKLLNRP
jgi:hypothetical protein